MDSKKKISKWKIVIGLLFFPFTLMYFMFKGIFTFYKSDKYTKKFKLIVTGLVFVIWCILGIISTLTSGPELQKVLIKDVELFKDEETQINIECSPKDVQIREIEFVDYDKNIISVDDDKITGLTDGKTTAICKVKDDHSNIVESNEFTITVKLTEEQLAQKTKEEEQRKKEEQEKLEKLRNTISTTEGITIKDYCEDIINSILKAPSTAEYPGSFLNPFENWNMKKVNNLVTVQSYVDAQNSFGAKIRSEFIIQIQMTDDGSGTATYVQFDGEVLKGTYKK